MSHSEAQPTLIGDHLALDFLNSRVSGNKEFADWLDGDQNFLDWLLKVNIADESILAAVKLNQQQRQLLVEQAKELRNWLEGFVSRLVAGNKAEHIDADIQFINSLLSKDSCYAQIEGDYTISNRRRWQSPESLLQPIINAIADLICHVDPELIKQCEAHNCILYFHDRTKAHKRRWCSMAICGNRAKAAANRARKAQSSQ
ncbi:MAG: CGNR zinc finger domain-containing protein [Pseudohongiellaceae bacterium]|nr:CGNR zinc finger domain-containing protein [Pseudohongiellaceae bacterium]